MSLRTAAVTLVCAAVLSGGLLAIQLTGASPSARAEGDHAHHGGSNAVTFGATWAERPKSLQEMKKRAVAVMEAEVVSIDAGPDLPSEERTIATQRITFRSVDSLKGAAPETFVLFKTGSATMSLEGDPPYSVGEHYVMFVERRTDPNDGTWLPIGPDGRLKLDKDKRIKPLIDGPVASELAGKSKDDVKASVGG